MMPYLQPQYISEVLYVQPHEPYFIRRITRKSKHGFSVCCTESVGKPPLFNKAALKCS
ncbi:hypothetical protein PO124_09745 [Bacillus licheniformis]|nr:hypothetical protein [Bacillus licheniformis]